MFCIRSAGRPSLPIKKSGRPFPPRSAKASTSALPWAVLMPDAAETFWKRPPPTFRQISGNSAGYLEGGHPLRTPGARSQKSGVFGPKAR